MTKEKAQSISDAIATTSDTLLKTCAIKYLKIVLAGLSDEILNTWNLSTTGRLNKLITKEQERRAMYATWAAYIEADE